MLKLFELQLLHKTLSTLPTYNKSSADEGPNLETRYKDIVAAEELAHYELYFQKSSAAAASESVYMGEMFNPFPHTANLQQTTLETSRQTTQTISLKKIYLLKNVENIVAGFEQFLLLSQRF